MSMREVAGHQVAITGGFWGQRLQTNARQALPHQWQQLEQGLGWLAFSQHRTIWPRRVAGAVSPVGERRSPPGGRRTPRRDR